MRRLQLPSPKFWQGQQRTHLFFRSGTIEGGNGGIEQADVNRLGQIPKLLGRHIQKESEMLIHSRIKP